MLVLFVIIERCFLVNGILGGHGISIKQAPYQANYGDICGAVLVHRQWALTSAHCGTEEAFIRVGSKHRIRGPKITIRRHYVHPKYGDQHTFDYDIQLLLFRRLHFSKHVTAIDFSNGRIGEHVFVSGWGLEYEKRYDVTDRITLFANHDDPNHRSLCFLLKRLTPSNNLSVGDYNDLLQQVRLKIVPMKECQEVNNSWYNHTLTSRMFCAGGEGVDACQGDSGGAAVSFGRLIGLSSFGFGCGRRVPGVYTNVTEGSVRNWIQRHIKV